MLTDPLRSKHKDSKVAWHYRSLLKILLWSTDESLEVLLCRKDKYVAVVVGCIFW
jgi:hypothetical protein